MRLLHPIDWDLLMGTVLWGTAAGMIVAAYCYVMIRWVMNGKGGTQDFDET